MLYLLNLRKSSAQVELDQFFKHRDNQKFGRQVVTKSAFFQARPHLSHLAFRDLNHSLVGDFYSQARVLKRWRGFRLCAIDGSQVRLPKTPDVVNEFGSHPGRDGQTGCPLGLASVFFDVLNHVAIDAHLGHSSGSEREYAAAHLEYAHTDDLVVYDRGYNAFWLYALHRAIGTPFCMRAKINRGKEFKRFADSGLREAMVTLSPGKEAIEKCQGKGLSTAPIRLRLVRVDLPEGVEVLITNLFDSDHFPAVVFKNLYHLRWKIEENYKRLKQWVEIENYSGKSTLSVRQDFHANILAANLTALLVVAAQACADIRTRQHRNTYQINFAQALSKMKHTMVTFIEGAGINITQTIVEMIQYISITVEAVKDGRSFPRRQTNMKNKIHHMAYKRAL